MASLMLLLPVLSLVLSRRFPGSSSARTCSESRRMIREASWGGEDEAGRRAGAGKLHLSSSAVSPSHPSSLCSLQKQSHRSPSPSLRLQPIVNRRGTKPPPPPPHTSSPLPCLCVSQNYPKTRLLKRTGFRGDSQEKPDLPPEPSAVGICARGGGGVRVIVVKQ